MSLNSNQKYVQSSQYNLLQSFNDAIWKQNTISLTMVMLNFTLYTKSYNNQNNIGTPIQE